MECGSTSPAAAAAAAMSSEDEPPTRPEVAAACCPHVVHTGYNDQKVMKIATEAPIHVVAVRTSAPMHPASSANRRRAKILFLLLVEVVALLLASPLGGGVGGGVGVGVCVWAGVVGADGVGGDDDDVAVRKDVFRRLRVENSVNDDENDRLSRCSTL